MSVTDGKQNVGCIDPLNQIKGLAFLVQYILLHFAYDQMNDVGESSLLNNLLVNINGHQAPEVLSEGGKTYLMGMIASIEYTLREQAKSERTGQ